MDRRRIIQSMLTAAIYLATAAVICTATVYQTVIRDVQLYGSNIVTIDVVDECSCRVRCGSQSNCTGASYDAVADVCLMTNASPASVTVRHLLDSTAFFKFKFTPLPVVFLSEGSVNGSLANQRALCGAMDGVPLIINSREVLNIAMEDVKTSGKLLPGRADKVAWTVAVKSSYGSYIWPDGTYLNTSVFYGVDINSGYLNGPASFLRASGKLFVNVAQEIFDRVPALCAKLQV